jgi:hypothetical protein
LHNSLIKCKRKAVRFEDSKSDDNLAGSKEGIESERLIKRIFLELRAKNGIITFSHMKSRHE